ncbi:MAG: sterol desaturase/sphingolipid hydroxylase (fatty acid hydroxylase superfamily) [Myxococcota bacterium]|jgi:sterol desaturase/sphingolipid hydroxylase (fatty acid hydroxylase superfamily)
MKRRHVAHHSTCESSVFNMMTNRSRLRVEALMIGIPLANLASDVFEWWMHKNVLHGRGKKKGDFWNFHWHDHHKSVRRNGHLDESYQRSVFGWHAQGKEAAGLAAVGLAHAPLLPFAPFYTMTVWYRILKYHEVHKRSHLDPEWAREHLPWHYDHHMGPNQDSNWGVTHAWLDELMGTREPYIGTEREKRDIDRRAARRARTQAREEARKHASLEVATESAA